jgi:CheY-like chemotaxis protein
MGGSRIVLVVDDDASTREAARFLLEDEGYLVDVAGDGGAALERLRAAPTPSLVLLDLMMPGMDGTMFLRELEASSELPEVPIIVMTASNPGPPTSSIAYPLLRKPFGIDELLRLVTTYCPRVFDQEEPTTGEDAILPFDETPRDRCATCTKRASTRCPTCGEPFCKRCFAAGKEGGCAVCARRSTA